MICALLDSLSIWRLFTMENTKFRSQTKDIILLFPKVSNLRHLKMHILLFTITIRLYITIKINNYFN